MAFRAEEIASIRWFHDVCCEHEETHGYAEPFEQRYFRDILTGVYVPYKFERDGTRRNVTAIYVTEPSRQRHRIRTGYRSTIYYALTHTDIETVEEFLRRYDEPRPAPEPETEPTTDTSTSLLARLRGWLF